MHARVFRKAAVAGTFDALHSGHADLFEKAFSEAQLVLVGITSDSFARRLKGRAARPFSERKKAVSAFLGKERRKRAQIFQLNDVYGPAASDPDLEALVVSTETLPRAEEINKLRKRIKFSQLAIIEIPLVYAEDLKKIASKRIIRGKISKKGRLLKPVVIAVGTANPAKLEGVRSTCLLLFPKFKIEPVKADSEVPSQPFSTQTLDGAINRAMSAFRKAGADYGVGLESGLFEHYGRQFDVQWCAVYDGENVTLGSSMGFEVPDSIVKLIKRKKVDMGKAFEELTGIPKIGKEKGAINFLSRGIAERKSMSEQAFLCAMIPRLNRLSYGSAHLPRVKKLYK